MKILLPDGMGVKANLHGHTTDSDGVFTPEQIKKFYKDKGYSVCAYTDHLYMRDRSSLCDESFIALNGYENVLCDGRPGEICKCYHFNIYSPRPDKVGMVGVSPWFYEAWNKNKTKEEKELSPVLDFCSEEHSVRNANAIIKRADEEGYAVIYNHPLWSLHDERDYIGLRGLAGVEVFNGGNYISGLEPDDQSIIYDRMLSDGQRLNVFATDDDHTKNDFFLGYTVMYPEKFDYESVFACIKSGACYASTGARTRGLAVDGNKVYLGVENARKVRFSTDAREGRLCVADDKPLTEAVFELGEYAEYFRVTVEDLDGKKAWTRAYFKDEIK